MRIGRNRRMGAFQISDPDTARKTTRIPASITCYQSTSARLLTHEHHGRVQLETWVVECARQLVAIREGYTLLPQGCMPACRHDLLNLIDDSSRAFERELELPMLRK